MSTAPKRRWFQWSLRTLFVMVTLFACWLGWQAHVVQERREMLQLVESQASDTFDPHYAILTFNDGGSTSFTGKGGESPWYRRMFGDHEVGVLGVPRNFTPAQISRLRHAFPEATISGHCDENTQAMIGPDQDWPGFEIQETKKLPALLKWRLSNPVTPDITPSTNNFPPGPGLTPVEFPDEEPKALAPH